MRITLSERIPSLLGVLTSYAGGFIISKKAYEERGDGFRRKRTPRRIVSDEGMAGQLVRVYRLQQGLSIGVTWDESKHRDTR